MKYLGKLFITFNIPLSIHFQLPFRIFPPVPKKYTLNKENEHRELIWLGIRLSPGLEIPTIPIQYTFPSSFV